MFVPISDSCEFIHSNLYVNDLTSRIKCLNQPLRNSFEKLTEMTHRVSKTASLHLTARLGIPDILGPVPDSSDSEGIHIDKLAAEADVPVSKLARLLRLLTTSGWFEEVEEDVFRNTKLSDQLRGGSDEYCWVGSRCVVCFLSQPFSF
jgi:hypothetical protein